MVDSPYSKARFRFPLIISTIERYILLPGTKGIKAQIENIVEGHFSTLAKISDSVLKKMLVINIADMFDIPIAVIRP